MGDKQRIDSVEARLHSHTFQNIHTPFNEHRKHSKHYTLSMASGSPSGTSSPFFLLASYIEHILEVFAVTSFVSQSTFVSSLQQGPTKYLKMYHTCLLIHQLQEQWWSHALPFEWGMSKILNFFKYILAKLGSLEGLSEPLSGCPTLALPVVRT